MPAASTVRLRASVRRHQQPVVVLKEVRPDAGLAATITDTSTHSLGDLSLFFNLAGRFRR